MKSVPLSEYGLLLVLATLWGSSYIFLKVAVTEIPPASLIALRVTVATLFLSAVMWVRNLSLPRDPSTWRKLFIQSIFNSTGAWLVLAWGQQFIDASLGTVLNSTSPIFVFLITVFLTRHESTSPIRLLGAGLGLFGVILIVGTEALSGLGEQLWGQLAVLLGAMLYAYAAIYGRNFSDLPPAVTATGTMLCASVILIPLSVLTDAPWELQPSATALSAAFALAILSTGCALLIYFRLLKTLGSMGTASQAYLRVGIGVLLGTTLLGDTLTPTMIVGMLCAVLGVIAINRRPRAP